MISALRGVPAILDEEELAMAEIVSRASWTTFMASSKISLDGTSLRVSTQHMLGAIDEVWTSTPRGSSPSREGGNVCDEKTRTGMVLKKKKNHQI